MKYREKWLQQLSDVIIEPRELLQYLLISKSPQWQSYQNKRYDFAFRVPRVFVDRIKKGDPNDPLLLQVMTSSNEFLVTPGYSKDPLKEQQEVIVAPGLLHKYTNRILLLVKSSCAINCRYCFRRYFPYHYHQGNKKNWRQALDYISQQLDLEEVIFSGGDPLMAKDHELIWLIKAIENITHIKRLRIHSRLPVVIPDRITKTLIQCLYQSHLHIILVTHINHPNEINKEVCDAMMRLKNAQVTLLNQSVLLRGVNNNANTLANLSKALFNSGIMPYYLHMLDKVQGTAHFMVLENEACIIMQELITKIPGYMVPKLTRDIDGERSKTLINFNVKNN
ncbi:L-lysine 2,3-aminomutase [Candidatus Profftia lariciata]|nr:EF-P beta-lysylation protein EpmB [Candidatus Profftia lariciata]UDG81378.1 L-lysine 2,3-aminomutase [Candidatus Profftia lariciata]